MSDGKTKVLLAEPDVESAKRLGKAFKERGMEAFYAKDGAKALQVAIEKSPHVIVTEITLPVLNAIRLSQILKSNPKTKDIPIVYLSSGDVNPAYLPFFRNSIIKKPFNVEEVMTRLDASLMTIEKSREIQGEAKEIEGNLAQMSLVDILQIFSMNKKSGAVVVRREELGEEGMVFLKEGNIINATAGLANAEKALYRLLGWNSGKFEYMPQDFHPEANIRKSTDSLLMEGMRHLDEWKRMEAEFPPMKAGVRLKVDPARLSSVNLRPQTKEVISLLAYYKQVSDIVNNSAHCDYDVMMTLLTLINKGVVEIFAKEKDKAKTARPLLTAEEGLAIKGTLKTALREGFEMDVVKVPVFCDNFDILRKLVALLSAIDGFRPEKSFFEAGEKETPLGGIGRVKASENITLLFMAFPLERFYSPLWRPLMGGAVGALILRDADTGSWSNEVPRLLMGAARLKTAFLDFDKDVKPSPPKECFRMNMWEVEIDDVRKAMHKLFDAFLNL